MAAVVEGLRDLQVAFKLAGKTSSVELRAALRDSAEPVRADAQTIASLGLHPSKVDWSQMRVGISRTMVYVAPKQRGKKSRHDHRRRRPNVAPILAHAMETSLDQNEPEVMARVQRVVDSVGRVWETA
jgi:hypothetical protein